MNIQKTAEITRCSNESQYRNIIFDLGAVLIHWDPVALARDHFPHYLDDIIRGTGIATASEWLAMDRGVSTPEDCARSLASKIGCSVHDVLKFISLAREKFVPLADGVDILNRVQARGYRTYVLSNMSQWAYDRIAEYDFLKTFDGHIFSYRVNMVKPEPGIYQALLQSYNLDPANCIFIDDMQKNIDAARELGIDGIVCSNHAYVVTELSKRGIL